MNDIGQYGVFFLFFDIVIFPVIGQLVAGFLPHPSLLNLFLAPAVLLPVFARALSSDRGRVCHILHPFVTDFGQTELDWLCLGAVHRLNKTEKSFWISDIC